MNYRSDLITSILPFWLNSAIDRENGGIFTSLDKKGRIYGRDKSVWFQGRALWTFAKAYNVIEKDPKYLEAAQRIYSFLPRCIDTDGRMFFTVTEDGRELQKRSYYFSETFAAVGCAELYKATGDERVRADAEKYFDVAYECFTGVRKNAPKINPESRAMKALSPVMIMLNVARTMCSMNDGRKDMYSRICSECLHEILHGGYLTENALLESVTVDGQFSDTPSGRVVNPGHSMEAAHFILLEGMLTNNREAIEAARHIIDVTLPLGWDGVHGGLLSFTDVNGEPPIQLEWDMKLWWPQCEMMIAMRMAYEVFGDERYNEWYRKTRDYCEKHLVDHEDGEWYGYLHYDNTVSNTLKGNIFKGPFHVPRLYMMMAVMEEEGTFKAFAR